MAETVNIRSVILRYIQQHGYAPRVADVARLIGKPHNRTNEAIERLMKAGKVKRDREKVWVIR